MKSKSISVHATQRFNPIGTLAGVLLFAATTGIVCGQGVTYPNGTVSPYPPGFFGVGIPANADGSKVFGVAAVKGQFIGAAGVVLVSDGSGPGTIAAHFQPSGGITILPLNAGASRGMATAISADGKIKVGNAGGAGYWDENDQLHMLPSGAADDGTVAALAVSADGSRIAGYVNFSDANNPYLTEAVVWTPGGTAPTRLGIPAGFMASVANSISDDGSVVGGFVERKDATVDPPAYFKRGALFFPGSGTRALPTVGGNVASSVYGVSESGAFAVGNSGDVPALWASTSSADQIPGKGTAYAVRFYSPTPGTQRNTLGMVLGTREIEGGGGVNAFLWNVSGRSLGPVKDVLLEDYKVTTAKWYLTEGYAISQDGTAIGGEGINPDGKIEGWVAVLPPILFPPVVTYGTAFTVKAGKTFSIHPHVKRGNVHHFSARGLPNGFQINSTTGVVSGSWDTPATSPGEYSVTVQAVNVLDGTGTTSFKLILPTPGEIDDLLGGTSFLPDAKAPDNSFFQRSFGGGMSSDASVVVGQDGSGNDARAFRFSAADGITHLPMLAGAPRRYGTATAASANGATIVGQAASPVDADGNTRSVAVVWKADPAKAGAFGVTNIGLFEGGIVSAARGVSADGGVVVGYGDAKEEFVNYQIFDAFRWTQAGGVQRLGWLPGASKTSQAFGVSPDGSVIVGYATDNTSIVFPTSVAFRWTEATGMVSIGRLPGGIGATGRAVSADNSTIVGDSWINSFTWHAMRWTQAGGMVDLGVLAGHSESEAHAVSADGGVIVGYSSSGFTTSKRAFIWDAAHGMRDLKSVLTATNPYLTGWTLRSANAISADGKTISGDGVNPNGDSEAFVASFDVGLAVTSFSPSSGLPGTTVTIFGKRLIDTTAVQFNGISATFTATADDRITATVPAAATNGPISIVTPTTTASSANSFVVFSDADSDGLPDSFEQQYFGQSTAGNPGDDTDGDGASNLAEYWAGTDPTNASSTFRIAEARRDGDDVVIVVAAKANRVYRVEASTSLQDGFPIEIGTFGPSPTDILFEVRDSDAAAQPRRFYRSALVR